MQGIVNNKKENKERLAQLVRCLKLAHNWL